MTSEQAVELAGTLHERGCRAYLATERGYQRIVFTGGRRGEHSLDVGVSSPERVRAHWDGYLSSGAPSAPAPVKAAKSLRRYTVRVEGRMPVEWHDYQTPKPCTEWTSLMGWIELDASSVREARGLARRASAGACTWENDGDRGAWTPRRIVSVEAVHLGDATTEPVWER
jgi:hypothetical protein